MLVQENSTEALECFLPLEYREWLTYAFVLSPVNFSPFPPPPSVKLAFLCTWGLILLAGLISNVLVIAWIARGKPKRTGIDVYIVSLGVTDLLSGVTIIPLQITLLTVESNWNLLPESHALSLCKASIYIQTATICISLLTLGIIAIDRYLAICHPLYHYKLRERRKNIAMGSIIVIWLLGLLMGIPDAIGVRLSHSIFDNFTEQGYDSITDFLSYEILYVPDVGFYEEFEMLIPGVIYLNSTCQELNFFRTCKASTHVSSTVLFILIYIIPQVILAFCYIRISHRLWIRRTLGDISSYSTQSGLIKKSSRRTTIIMMVMVIAFGLLWLPYWCKKMYDIHKPKEKSIGVVKFDEIDMSFTMLTHLCIISSPIIYMINDRAFQRSVKSKIQRLIECSKPSLITKTERISSHKKTTSKCNAAVEHPSLTARGTA